MKEEEAKKKKEEEEEGGGRKDIKGRLESNNYKLRIDE
jgi:hypothetical protein